MEVTEVIIESKDNIVEVTNVGLGEKGDIGKSAYQSWLDQGNTGTEQDFIESLKGAAGSNDYNDLINTPDLSIYLTEENIIPGDNIQFNINGNDITINVDSSSINLETNQINGLDDFIEETNTSLSNKLTKANIIAGDNITLVEDGNNITISGTGGGANIDIESLSDVLTVNRIDDTFNLDIDETKIHIEQSQVTNLETDLSNINSLLDNVDLELGNINTELSNISTQVNNLEESTNDSIVSINGEITVINDTIDSIIQDDINIHLELDMLGNEIETKVSKETGKGLSANDFTNTDKTKLDSLSNYTLPISSTTVLGGIKIGAGLAIDAGGVVTASGGSVNEGAGSGGVNTSTVYAKDSMTLNTTGARNTVLGNGSLNKNTTGSDSIAIGYRALYSNQTAPKNLALGNNAIRNLINGTGNIFIGDSSGYNRNYINKTIAIGCNALVNGEFNDDNIAIGDSVGGNFGGNGMVALGVNTFNSRTSGNYCTALGWSAGNSSSNYSNISLIGANSNVTADNQVQLGDSATTTYVYGTVQNRSDERDKIDIRDTILGKEFILSLRPVDYRLNYREDYKETIIEDEVYSQEETDDNGNVYQVFKTRKKSTVIIHENDGSRKRNRFHSGLLAGGVKEVCDNMGVDFGGYQDHNLRGGDDVLSLGYDEFIAPLIKTFQEQEVVIQSLMARLDALENK